MKSKRTPAALLLITALALSALACNIAISDVFGDESPPNDDFLSEPEYEAQLTATFSAIETLIVEATQTAAAKSGDPDAYAGLTATAAQLTQQAEPGGPDMGEFCAIYSEMVAEVSAIFTEYEAAVTADQPAQDIAVGLDQTFEGYYDQLVDPAPDDIRPDVEALAAMPLVGLFSSPEPFPVAEGLIQLVDMYASENCDISFNE